MRQTYSATFRRRWWPDEYQPKTYNLLRNPKEMPTESEIQRIVRIEYDSYICISYGSKEKRYIEIDKRGNKVSDIRIHVNKDGSEQMILPGF